MQEQDRGTSPKELRARAAKFLTQARETDDEWFVEQLRADPGRMESERDS
jgi:hypothetical protein